MPGPAPKPPGQRRRRNTDGSAPRWKTLPPDSGRDAPPLLKREAGWSEQVIDWWKTIWASPMAALWLPADMGALHDLAELRQQFADGENVSSHIRAIEDRVGLTPKSRNMLAWQVPVPGVDPLPGTPGPVEPAAEPAREATSGAPVRRLRAVDPGA